jgi:hypothetical protein
MQKIFNPFHPELDYFPFPRGGSFLKLIAMKLIAQPILWL